MIVKNKMQIKEILVKKYIYDNTYFFSFKFNKNKGILFLSVNFDNNSLYGFCDYITDEKEQKKLTVDFKKINLFEITFNEFYNKKMLKIIDIKENQILFFKKRCYKFFPILQEMLKELLK